MRRWHEPETYLESTHREQHTGALLAGPKAAHSRDNEGDDTKHDEDDGRSIDFSVSEDVQIVTESDVGIDTDSYQCYSDQLKSIKPWHRFVNASFTEFR